MPAASHLLLSTVDPRGRCNRKGLLLLALALLAAQTLAGTLIWLGGVALDSPGVLALKLVFLWLAIAAAAKRLHDTGRSAWWILWCVLATMVWSTLVAVVLLLSLGDNILIPGSGGFEIHFALTMLPVLAATVWLHFAPGEPRPNRYGLCPQDHGLAGPLMTGQATTPALTEAPAAA